LFQVLIENYKINSCKNSNKNKKPIRTQDIGFPFIKKRYIFWLYNSEGDRHKWKLRRPLVIVKISEGLEILTLQNEFVFTVRLHHDMHVQKESQKKTVNRA
jgi:hypothetical protein